MMMNLIPEEVSFEISTTDLSVRYDERNETHLTLDVLKKEHYLTREKYTEIAIIFDTVAELKCCSLNFEEIFHEEYEVFDITEGLDILDFWNENGYHPDSGFYQVDNSQWLKESKSKYDPQNNLGLKHFLIFGNDSYVEVLAAGYFVQAK